jgi:6-phosphogluconolactonase (cycloisomerase 2 family)
MAGESLRIVRGAGAGTQIPLRGDFIVGRGETGMGNLAGDPKISRRHARFRQTDQGQVIVEDLGSTNGTLVGGRRLTGPHVLSPGDQITVGNTVIQLDTAAPPAPPAPPAPAAAPPARPPQAGGDPVPRFAGGPGADASYGRGRRRRGGILLGLVVLALVAAAVVVVVTRSDDKSSKGTAGSSVAADCGANIGKGGNVAYVSYVESNVAADGKNSVILIPHEAGTLKPLAMSQCTTGGSGSTDLTDSGVLDANDQVIVNEKHTLLFAVNQGSDTIAVFGIQSNGGLKPVAGSPFSSSGKAPSSLGLSGNILVVANKAQDGVRDLKSVAPNYTTFTVGSDGKLTAVPGSSIDAKPGSSPTDASVPARGGVAFGTEESGPIRSFTVSKKGALTQAPGSPYDPPAQAFGQGFDPAKEFALGVATHPTKNLVYMGLPTIPALAVYSFDSNTGGLTFVSSVPVQGAYLPCWIQITKDGHWLYTSNADTNNITAFDISNPTKPKQIQTLSYLTPGNPWNIQLSPDDKYLFGITPRDTPKVPEGEGNTAHVMSIGSDGKLTELNTASPTKLPVSKTTQPQGIAVIAPG